MTPSSAPRAAEAAADLAGPPTRAWTLRRRPSRTPTTRLSEDWRWPTRVYIVPGHVFGNERTGAAAVLAIIRGNRGRTRGLGEPAIECVGRAPAPGEPPATPVPGRPHM